MYTQPEHLFIHPTIFPQLLSTLCCTLHVHCITTCTYTPLAKYIYMYIYPCIERNTNVNPLIPHTWGIPVSSPLHMGGSQCPSPLHMGGSQCPSPLHMGGSQCPSPLHMGGSQCPSPLHMGGSQCLAIRQSLTHGDPSVQPLDSPLHMGDPSVQPLDSPLHMGGSQCPAIRQSLTHGGIPVSSH